MVRAYNKRPRFDVPRGQFTRICKYFHPRSAITFCTDFGGKIAAIGLRSGMLLVKWSYICKLPDLRLE